MDSGNFFSTVVARKVMADNQEITGPVSQEDIEAAEKLKNEANEYFKSEYFSTI